LNCFFQVSGNIVGEALSSFRRGMFPVDQYRFHSAPLAAKYIGILVAYHPGKAHVQTIFFLRFSQKERTWFAAAAFTGVFGSDAVWMVVAVVVFSKVKIVCF